MRKNCLGCCLTGLLALLFLGRVWKGETGWPGILAAVALCALFGLALWRFAPEWCAFWSGAPEREPLPHPKARPFYKSPGFTLVLSLVAWRLVVFLLGHILQAAVHGDSFADGLHIWRQSDANSYLGIAENWYVNEGDPRFHIVFFPFYPVVMRLFAWLGSYFAAALFVSNACAVAGGYMLYRLASLDMEEQAARRAVKYLNILPAAFFMNAAMSDSLFFLLSVSAVYCMRRRRYVCAGLLGMLAAYTRSLGILLLVPMGMEIVAGMLREARGRRFTHSWKKLLCLGLIPLGLAAYLMVNYAVTGDALRFLTYQREHWSQSLGWFFETAAYQLDYAVQADPSELIGLWLPNLFYLFGSLALVTAAHKKLRASYTGFFLVYFAVATGVTWLLSGPRYLTFAFPLPLALAALTRGRRADAVVTAACLCGFLVYLGAFAAGWPVY